VRAEAYHLLDDVDPGEQHERRLLLRAQALRLLVETTSTLVAAGPGAP